MSAGAAHHRRLSRGHALSQQHHLLGPRGAHLRALAFAGAFGLVAGACVTVTGEDSAASTPLPVTVASPAASETAALPSDSPAPVAQLSPLPSGPPAPSPGPSLAAASEPTTEPTPQPTPEPTPVEPSIGYIALDGAQAYVQAISSGMRQAADAAGIELIECDAGWTRPGVRACARKLGGAGITGIVSMQPFGDLAEEICETTGNVPTIGIVYEQGPCQVSLLDIDQAESGRLAGAALGALALERWECDVKAYVSLGSGSDDPIGGARMEGYRAGFKEHCPMPRQKVVLNDTQHLITARTQMASVLDDVSGKPIVVAGVSDSAALGALQAADAAGRANHVWVVGQLAEPVARETIACDKHFVASVAQFPERFGQVAVPAMVAAMGGAEVPKALEADMALVTRDNVRELFGETPVCRG